MKICDEFWFEFMKWAVPMYKIRPESDIYDVFVWIRELQQGSTPFSDSFLAIIDAEIEKDLIRERRTNPS